ncbi:MAG: hypothetical protein ACRBF0_17020 [Calditrichia bacterium]
MDRQFILENNIVEKYLLGRLSDTLKLDYERHLADSAESREELEQQRMLIGGLRQIGRDEMKAEIRRQTEAARAAQAMREQQQASDFSWGMLLRVAAILFIAVAAPSLYYFTQSQTQNEQMAAKFDTETEESLVPADVATADSVFAKMADKKTERRREVQAKPGRTAKLKNETSVPESEVVSQNQPVVSGEARQSDALAPPAPSTLSSGSGARAPAELDAVSSIATADDESEPEGFVAEDRVADLVAEEEPAIRSRANVEAAELQEKPTKAMAEASNDQTFGRSQSNAQIFSYSPASGKLYSRKRHDKLFQNSIEYKSQEKENFALPQFNFSSGDEIIRVEFKLHEKLAKAKDAYRRSKAISRSAVEGFAVTIAGTKTGDVLMQWAVEKAFFDYPLEDIKLIKLAPEKLKVVIQDSIIYNINMSEDSTRAVKEK